MKKINSRIIAMLLVVALTMSMLPTAFATDSGATFQDVGVDHWAYSYVEQAVALGLFQGIDENTFDPAGTMTRGMFMTVLNRMSGEIVDNDTPTGFEDVAPGRYFTGAVAWAVSAGITKGTTETTFAPFEGTTRQQAAVFLYRYAQYMGLDLPEGESVEFTDAADIGAYAEEAVDAMSSAGIIKGYTDGTFLPKTLISRAEAATMLVRFWELAQPEPTYYSVSFVAPHATVTVDGKETTFSTITNVSSLTFTPVAEENYEITNVSATSGTLAPNEDGSWTLSDVTENVIVSVQAESSIPETYVIRFSTEHATVTVGGEAVTSVTAAEGDVLTFAVSAEEGYTVAEVLASAGYLQDNGDGTWSLSRFASDVEVAVVATEIETPDPEPETYTITFVTDEGVKVYVDGVETTTATTTSADASFTFVYQLTAEHTQIYTAEVSPAGSLNRAGNAYVLTGISGDTTITLTTGIETFTVTFSTESGATKIPAQTVEYQGTATAPEDPSLEGCFFGGWYADENLVYDYDFSTPVTADITVYAGFGTVVDTVYLDGQNGSNKNDGGSRETPIYSGSWASKLAAHSTTKHVVILGMPYVTLEEVWDASGIEGGIYATVDESFLAPYGAYAVYVEGNAKLTINNWEFACERSADETVGATFAVTGRSYLYDENGNVVYDENDSPVMFFGELTLNNCVVHGFGNLPMGGGGYGLFSNACISAYGPVFINGGEYYDNLTSGGGVLDLINDTSGLSIDGAEFYNNESRYCPGVTDADGDGGVISSINLKKITIRNSYFHDNVANNGGAIMMGNGEELILENCVFENNTSYSNGGAISVPYGGAVLTLEGNNQFIGNKAVSGGALYLYNAQTITGGTFRDNSAEAYGDAIFSRQDLTIAPAEGVTLAIDDAFYAANGKGIHLAGSIAHNEGTILAEVVAAVPGQILFNGSGYTITEADFAKTGCSVSADIELDTAANVIKVKEAKNEGGDGDGDEGGEDNEPHNLSTVYLSGSGSDNNDGATAATAVMTFQKAKGLLAKDGTIVICGVVNVSGSETWSLDAETFGNAKVVRSESYTNGYLVNVTGALTLKNITIDGQNVSTNKSAIYGKGASVTLGKGTVITGVINTDTYGAVAYCSNGTVTIDGAIITNSRAGSSYGAMIYATTVVMTDGLISGCSSTGAYGGGIYATNITMSGGEISNGSFTGTYGAALCGGYKGGMTISGGKISGNTCYGAAVSAPSSGSMTMTGGEISGNTSANSNTNGGGISGSGEVKLLGGTIANNTTNGNGGGVYTGSNTKIIIDGVTISGNKAGKQGGGVYVFSTRSTQFLSGTIENNTAATGGADVYLSKELIATFAPNEKGLTIGGEIYVANNSYFKTNGSYVGDLTNLNGKLLFNFQKIVAGTVVATPVDGYTLTEADFGKFGCTGCNMSYVFNDDGKIVIKTFPVEGIELDKTELTIMATYTDTLTATLNPADASNLAVTWTSSNTSVAKVSGNLLNATITGVAPGTATIKATAVDGGVYAECVVTVTENTTPITEIVLDRNTMKMEGGDTATLTATVSPWNAYSTTVTWASSDETVIAISGSGSTVTVTALADGEATVTATAADGKTASCVITVADTKVESITVSPETVNVATGDTASVTGILNPSDATVQDVVWTTSDASVATVITYGTNAVVYGVAPGTATITATTVDGGFTDSVEVNVTKASENALSLDLTELDLVIYQSFNITALFETYGEDVTWTTSDPETVRIQSTSDNQVTIQAMEAGSATITATAADGQTAECFVSVEVRVAGTQDVVYVEYSNSASDANDGLTSKTPVKNLSTAIQRVGVDGTIYIQGSMMFLNDGDNITLPKEIYGDAKIVVISSEEVQEYPWGPEIMYNTLFFSADGYVTFSDVTIDYSQAGECNYAFSFRDGAQIVFSNGAKLLGSNGKTSQQAMYQTGWDFLMNGGEINGFVKNGSYGSFRCLEGDFVMNGGKIVNCGARNYGGALGIDGSNFTMNGGEISGNICNNGAGAAIYADEEGSVTINGGIISGNIADREPNGAGICLNQGANVTINAKYDLEIADGIQYSDNTAKLKVGSLHNLKGTLKVYVDDTVRSGMTVIEGKGKNLTWEELSKITLVNGNNLVLDMDRNVMITE